MGKLLSICWPFNDAYEIMRIVSLLISHQNVMRMEIIMITFGNFLYNFASYESALWMEMENRFPSQKKRWDGEEKCRDNRNFYFHGNFNWQSSRESLCTILNLYMVGRSLYHECDEQKKSFYHDGDSFEHSSTSSHSIFSFLFFSSVVVFSNQHLYYFYDKSTLRMLIWKMKMEAKAWHRNWKYFTFFYWFLAAAAFVRVSVRLMRVGNSLRATWCVTTWSFRWAWREEKVIKINFKFPLHKWNHSSDRAIN